MKTSKTALALTAFVAAGSVQLVNSGTEHFTAKTKNDVITQQALGPEIKFDNTNYVQVLREARDLVREQDYSEAAKKLDILNGSDNKKILLEVAKIRIRKDTPLYSYSIASEILLSLINDKALRGEAAFLLARHHMRAVDFETQKKSAPLLHQAVEWEFEIAHSYLGDVYSKGIGKPRKLVVALAHYEKAATAFSAAPIIAFARRIASLKAGEVDCGINPERIVARHLPSLQIEARGGKISAAKELGRIFHKGKLVKRDIPEARKWLTDAVNSGNPGAMRDLAILEMKFPTSENSMDKAISLLEQSANAGNAAAYTSLGRIYLKDQTPEMDEKAIEAFETAARSGHKPALKELSQLEVKLSGSLDIDPIVTGSISNETNSSGTTSPQTIISTSLLNAANETVIETHDVCEMPEPKDFNNIRAYFE